MYNIRDVVTVVVDGQQRLLYPDAVNAMIIDVDVSASIEIDLGSLQVGIIDWGDGTITNQVVNHTYQSQGQYTIHIYMQGNIPVDFLNSNTYITQVIFPDHITDIPDCLHSCTALKTVIFGKKVSSIAQDICQSSTNLQAIVFTNSIPPSTAMNKFPSTCKVFVPNILYYDSNDVSNYIKTRIQGLYENTIFYDGTYDQGPSGQKYLEFKYTYLSYKQATKTNWIPSNSDALIYCQGSFYDRDMEPNQPLRGVLDYLTDLSTGASERLGAKVHCHILELPNGDYTYGGIVKIIGTFTAGNGQNDQKIITNSKLIQPVIYQL